MHVRPTSKAAPPPPSPGSASASVTDAFTHRHLRGDTFRQQQLLAKLASSHAAGHASLHDVVAVLRLASCIDCRRTYKITIIIR